MSIKSGRKSIKNLAPTLLILTKHSLNNYYNIILMKGIKQMKYSRLHDIYYLFFLQ